MTDISGLTARSTVPSFPNLKHRTALPLTLPLRGFRWLVGGSNRKLARTGLLESHYERFLYGDTSLFELPERPQLHILATNLSEGCLCSFTRDGLLMVRRHPGGKFRIDRIHNLFRIDVLATSPKTQVRFPPQLLRPHLRMSSLESAAPGEKQCRWQVSWNFEKVPAGEYVDLIYEYSSPAVFLRREDGLSSVAIPMQVDTAEVSRWFLMPRRKEYKDCRILRYPTGKPEGVESVKVVSEYLAEDSTILAYKLLSAKAGYTYEVTWFYK